MKSISKYTIDYRGSAITMVIIIIMVVSVLGISIIGAATSNYKMAKVDRDNQSTYYIAEAGINHTIKLIEDKVNYLYEITSSADDFFNALENYLNQEFVLDKFEVQFGIQPFAHTNITGSREQGDKSSNYILTTIGSIGNSYSKLSTEITVNWDEGAIDEPISLDNTFIYGPKVYFAGNSINGKGGTMVSGAMTTHDLNGGATLNITNMYFNGPVIMNGGSASFGNKDQPGSIYVNGDLELWNGTRQVYGDVYINGDFRLKDARIHGNVYVDGNIELGWTTQIHKKLYYTGTLTAPANYPQALLDRCIKVDNVPSFEIPNTEISLQEDSWYIDNGYTIMGDVNQNFIPNHKKIFANNFVSNGWQGPREEDVYIISKGDIIIGNKVSLTGVLIAPNGKVEFGGASFTGVVISQDGFYVTLGGAQIHMGVLEDFFTEETLPIIIAPLVIE